MERKSSLSAAMNNVLFGNTYFFTGELYTPVQILPSKITGLTTPRKRHGSPLKLRRSRRKGKNEKAVIPNIKSKNNVGNTNKGNSNYGIAIL